MAEITEPDSLESFAKGPYRLKPNAGAMRRLAFGSALTVSTLICLPDAIGIIPVVPDPFTWAVRMLGLWLSAFILWFLSFVALLRFAGFAGGGILITAHGLRFWRFGKALAWASIRAVTVESQPFFSFAFRLKPVARRLAVYEEKADRPGLLKRSGQSSPTKLVPHPLPSFQF